MVDRRLGARGAKSAQNKDKQKNVSRHLHNCGLSILAIGRRRHFYQSQSSGQAIFSDRANFFWHRSKNLIHDPFRHVCLFGLVLLRFLLTLFLEKKMSELTGDWRTRPRAALLPPAPSSRLEFTRDTSADNAEHSWKSTGLLCKFVMLSGAHFVSHSQRRMRMGGDSNPRYLSAHTLSRRAQSTTLSPIQNDLPLPLNLNLGAMKGNRLRLRASGRGKAS